MNQQDYECSDERSRDPIDWAIMAVIVGGASLLLALEQKIEARNAQVQRDVQEKAVNANRVRLGNLQDHIASYRSLVSEIKNLGRVVVHEEKEGIRRTSIVFPSDEAEQRYLGIMDEVGNLIGRVNRLISELDRDGLPLNSSDLDRFVYSPLSEIQSLTQEALHPDTPSDNRFRLVDALLGQYGELLQNLGNLLSTPGPVGG